MKDVLHLVPEFASVRHGDGHVDFSRLPGTRIDLHCHSTASDERLRYLPGLVFHPLLEPWEVYDLAKARGMNFVTITDHDTIDGCLRFVDRRGEVPDFIFGEEVSVAFPDDGTVVHVNVFDIDEAQHREIQRLRGDIRDFVHYVRSIGKLYVLNHLTWTSQHRVLSTTQLDLILDLFDVFEGLNGTRSYAHNAFAWHATRGRGKTLVGGSDSHTHRVGTTYTLTSGASKAELLSAIRAGVAEPCGAFGTPEKLAEDVWLILQKETERRRLNTSSRWKRGVSRAVRVFGRATYPLVCRVYHAKQNSLISEFFEAMPSPTSVPA